MRRFGVPALATVSFLAFALVHAIDRPVYFAVLRSIHVHPFPRPFLDARFVTAQVECWSRGVDVYVRNPCDPLGRTLDYSPLWLRLPFLARSDGATPVFGLAIDLAFLAALFGLPWRLAGPFDAVVAVGAVMSWATIFAMERGNTDLLMFAAAVLFAHLSTRSAPARIAGYALILCVGLLKFYPLSLLALLVREPARRMWVLGTLCVLSLVAFIVMFHVGLSRIGGNMADGVFGDMFGARSLPFGIMLLSSGARLRDASGFWLGPEALDRTMTLTAWTLSVVLTGACATAAILCGRDPAWRKTLDRIPAGARAHLLVGAVLCVGCFFGHQNIGYRALFLLLVLPGLLALVRVAPTARARVVCRSTAAAIVLLLWDGIVSRSRPGWFVMQSVWWWVIFVLLTCLVSLLGGEIARISRGGRGAWAAMLDATAALRSSPGRARTGREGTGREKAGREQAGREQAGR